MVEEKLTKQETPKLKPKRSFGRRFWGVTKWILFFGLLCGFLAGGVVLGYVTSLVKDEPIRSKELIQEKIAENAITGYVFFKDGTPIGQLRTDEDRTLTTYDKIPQSVIDALVATEDNRFFDHPGIDLRGLSRAVVQKVMNQPVQTGGSTLTQQLARRVFLSLDKTDARKAKEIFLSLRIERMLSKEEIITAYLNKMPFGNGSNGYNVYGIKAAAKGIFNVEDLSKLTIAQSAYLAGLPQLPSVYTAFTGKGEYNEKGIARAIERQKLVLKRMLEENKITQQQYNDALAYDIRAKLAKPKEKAYSTYPYLMLEAERVAAETLLLQRNPKLTKADLRKRENNQLVEDARQELLRGGYRIYTTIDKQVYDAMKRVSQNADNFTKTDETRGIEQVAGVMIDHRTGAILGMIEGRDFYEEQMNLASQMMRQPGSTMKPLAAYLPAIDLGLVQPASILDDAPIVLKDGSKGFHIPGNANNRYQGLVTARDALNQSLNLPALKIFLDKVTIKKSWDFVQKLGITTIQPEDYQAQTGVIGGLKYGVTVEEITNAFGAIANQGQYNEPYFIGKIYGPTGTEVYKHKSEPNQVVSKQSAYLMTDMMKTVISDSRGTGRKVKSLFNGYGEYDVAAKTGSTQNYADSWFIGYTPDVTMGIWIGYEKQIHVLNKSAYSRSTEIWSKVMNEVMKAKPGLLHNKNFERPDGIVRMTVSGFSGKLPNALTRAANRLVTDIFNRKYIPTKEEDALVMMKYITYNGVNYIPNPATPDDFTHEQVVVKREKPIQELIEELRRGLDRLSSSSRRRSLDNYLPADAKLDAPSQKDPRKDDGAAPSAPTSVRSESINSTSARISFSKSPQGDVVGYRLYRSLNGGAYQKMDATVLSGDDTRFTNYVSAGNNYSFYVTAVDVVGKESAPSAIVTLGGGSSTTPPSSGTGTPGSGGQTTPPGSGEAAEPGDQTTPETGGNGSTQQPGDQSPPVAELPDAPAQLRAKLTDLGVSLAWKASNNSPTEYHVYYSAARDGKYERIGSVPIPEFEMITMNPSGWYYVTAANSKGESKGSRQVNVEK
ncbi:transglycosylase domain-containing protein [Paenibacillus sp. ACRRX]|uniref:penicillin-binding protein 1A n=1 Tax=Paenibacillus sp. ACRRX TaxID=2918206 RepID=UPI001EF5D455|nr:penicillin-binding protein 1A [Paenibacillus sp. ACRRX]MCG7407633.1 transglycosylase domain-containing protein [Paenibacillus sp. ACRRX]